MKKHNLNNSAFLYPLRSLRLCGENVFRNSSAFYSLIAVVFGALLLIGAVVRVYGAWQLRHNLNPDSGIVALMAKHMAEGVDFPVFFYGQAYMGSLEPFVSALFCAFFGPSGFMVTLGTAFIGWFILPVVFAWGRDAHSPLAGLAAMAFCVIGPLGFYHYHVSPRGGYAVTMLLVTLMLWLASKLVIAGREGRSNLRFQWFLLGLFAGLGWWSNQLIIGAIMTAAVMGLFLLKTKVISLNTLFSAAGFFIGSLPFWTWNVLNGWQSFAFAGSIGQTPFMMGLKIFFLSRIPDLLDLNNDPAIWRISGTAIFIGATLLTFFAMLKMAGNRQDHRWIYLLTLFVFIVVSALIFSTSHFALRNTARYLLPLTPVIAVIIGVMTAQLAKKMPVAIAIFPLAVVIAGQTSSLSTLARRGKGEENYQRKIEECGRFLQSRQIGACYAPYGKHAWNFALNEKICFCDLPQDRYLPYARRADLADRIAIFDNFGDINGFIANCGGNAKLYHSGSTPVRYDFNPPVEGLSAISANDIASIRDSSGREIMPLVTDGNLDTCWISAVPEKDDEWLEIDFKTPQTVRMIRLLYGEYPENWQIAGQGLDGSWRTLTPCLPPNGYLWSGPRPFWSFGLDGYRLECRLPPERLKQLRIHRIETGCRLMEMQLFSPAAASGAEEAALQNILGAFRERGINRLYADRWPANAVFRESQGAVQTWLNTNIFTGCSLDKTLCLTPRTGILVREEDAAQCAQTMAGRLVDMRQTKIGPWILFDFSPGKWKPEYGENPELQWVGFSCLAGNNKHWAAELIRRSDVQAAKGNTGDAIALLQKAVEAWPRYPPAVGRLASIMKANDIAGADYWVAQDEIMSRPEIKAEINFKNGIGFAGLSLSTNTVSAGDAFTVRYFWKYPESGVKGRPCVFVHFLSDENILQDDHPLEKFTGYDFQPYPELFVETRTLVTPKTAPADEYSIKIGLYDASRPDKKRIPFKTALPNRMNSVALPAKLIIKY